MKRFYDEIFFPTIKEHEIKIVIDCGDTFDRRKYINFQSLHVAKNIWFDKIRENDLKLYSLVGNHTSFFKNTISVNSIDLLFDDSKIITIREPQSIFLPDGTEIGMIPWICAENYDQTMEYLKETQAKIVLGHLELAGFEMYKGEIGNQNGMSADIYKRFDFVGSGHFHKKSNKGNIYYFGAPYEMTWNDYDDPRGFHIYDTEEKELTYIKNPFIMFNKIVYDDSQKTLKEVMNFDVEKVKNTFTKVIIKNKTNPHWFDVFIERLTNSGVFDLQVVEDASKFLLEDNSFIDETEDTLTILSKYIENVELDVDKIKLDSFIKTLYNEALTIE